MIDSEISGTIKIFFSLSSAKKDRDLFGELYKHLHSLMRQGIVYILYDSLITEVRNINESIQGYISIADIIVLLMSADFFASDQCVEEEMKYALKQHEARDAYVIPVLLRPTGLEEFPVEQFSFLPTNGEPVSHWDDRDDALLDVAGGIRRAVAEKLKQRLSSTPQSLSRKILQFPLNTLPYRSNPFFTDRKDILDKLHNSFTSGQDVQIRMQALRGQEGMGKTIIATEYIRLHQNEYQAILWLNAAPSELLSANIISLAEQLGISAQDAGDEQQRFAAMRSWLQHYEKWLIVIDNLEDFTLINQLIPLQASGHVLLIIRHQAARDLDSAISVNQMTVEDGALLLLRRAAIILEQTSRIATSEATFLQAERIAQELQSYPLALDLAGAYMKETGQSLSSYLKHYRQQQWWTRLLGRQGWFTTDYLDLITNTLPLTFKKIAQTQRAYSPSHLDPDGKIGLDRSAFSGRPPVYCAYFTAHTRVATADGCPPG